MYLFQGMMQVGDRRPRCAPGRWENARMQREDGLKHFVARPWQAQAARRGALRPFALEIQARMPHRERRSGLFTCCAARSTTDCAESCASVKFLRI